MIRNFGATGLTIQPQGLDLGLGGSNIKSIQRGTFLWGTQLTNTIAINAIIANNSIIIVGSGTTAAAGADSTVTSTSGTIIDNSSIKLDRFVATALSTLTVSWCVIEFNNVKSKQSGSQTYTGWTETTGITIATINPLKSLVFYSFYSKESGTNIGSLSLHAYIDSPTHVQIYPYGAKNLTWQVIEFN